MPQDKASQTVAKNLRRLREEAGLTQEGLGKRVGLHRTYISMCEQCHRNMTVGTLFALAQGLGCAPADLVEVRADHIRALKEQTGEPAKKRRFPKSRVKKR